MAEADTIAAVATPPGRGGIGVLRASGPAVPALARALLGAVPEPRRASYRRFRDADGQTLDRGIALYFPAGESFTGEAVLELQGHGGPVVLDALLERLLALGARPARPGEFSERAFLNGRLDLAQAEAIADLIDSSSRSAARAAMRSLEGAWGEALGPLAAEMTRLRAHLEAWLDFPEDEVDPLHVAGLGADLERLADQVEALCRRAHSGRALSEGLRVVLAGAPNTGKSSLLNRLAQREAAIVTAIPGTTRDVLRERLHLDGLPLELVDTAGLRDTDDPIEREGVRRARAEQQTADVLLWVCDARSPGTPDDALAAQAATRFVVHNKIDLTGAAAWQRDTADGRAFGLSALSGDGIEALVAALRAAAGLGDSDGASFSARRRHVAALERTAAQVVAARAVLDAGLELAAEELRGAQQALGSITGEVSSEDLLGEIFATFCIGK